MNIIKLNYLCFVWVHMSVGLLQLHFESSFLPRLLNCLESLSNKSSKAQKCLTASSICSVVFTAMSASSTTNSHFTRSATSATQWHSLTFRGMYNALHFRHDRPLWIFFPWVNPNKSSPKENFFMPTSKNLPYWPASTWEKRSDKITTFWGNISLYLSDLFRKWYKISSACCQTKNQRLCYAKIVNNKRTVSKIIQNLIPH